MKKKWTTKDLDLMKALASKMTIKEVAEALGRSYDAVDHKARRLGITFHQPQSNVVLPTELGEIPAKVKITQQNLNKIITLIGDNLLTSLTKRKFKTQDVKLLTKYLPDKKEEQSILVLSDMHPLALG